MDMAMMSTTTWVRTAVAFVVIVASAIIVSHLFEHTTKKEVKTVNTKKKKRLVPPGPRGLPVIGHLHLIGQNPHKDLQKLSQTHGPIMRLRFGTVDTVVASSSHAARLFLKTNDLNFTNRASQQLGDILSYDSKDVVFGDYSPIWCEMRKLYAVELLSSQKVNSFEPLRRQELCLLIESLKKQCPVAVVGEGVVDLSATLASMNLNLTCRMLFGKKYEEWDVVGDDGKGFKAAIDEVIHLAGATNLGDYFPVLSGLDVQGLCRRAKVVKNVYDQFFERVLVDRENHKRDERDDAAASRDFVDILLGILINKETNSFEFTREHVKSMMLDLLIGAMDTSSTVVVWAMSELIKNPTKMKRLKEELERQVGLHRMVDEKDLEHLKYLEMVIKETLRLHPTAPLLIPRAAIEDCTVGDFHVPKNTKVIINVWAIGRDPNVWSDAEEFMPERFEGSNVDYRGRHFELLPFGSGRRGCPGLQLGVTMVRLMLAQLVHCFDWDLPKAALPAHDLDMTEKYGLVMNRAHNLMLVPTYKLLV
ncbi:unnamed protein product [Cuscuta campestris]|uniref:Uncharacterized protein n=1 Tax=Cuscuta campestris TaxID=132261 RepID=A0A484L1J1_9ASTE|nr:unnamed protein product [Cuscuta campestris]